MKNSPEINQILKIMEEKNRFLITSHKDPDGDSIGSQLGLFLALKNAGKEVIIVNQGGMPERYNFLDPDKLVNFTIRELPFSPEAVFVLECPSIDRIGFVQDLIPKTAPIVNIDHHLHNDGYGSINWVDTKSCAVGELIYFLLEQGEFKITPAIAEKLYAALMSDTGNFRFSSTTARGIKVAGELVDKGAEPKKIFDNIFAKASPSTLLLLGYTLSTLQVTGNGAISYMAVTRANVARAQGRIEDSEGFVDYSLAVSGVRMGILFKEIDKNEIKVSVRTQNGVDAAKFASRFDGGGHANAAGFTINKTFDDTIRLVIDGAREYLNAS